MVRRRIGRTRKVIAGRAEGRKSPEASSLRAQGNGSVHPSQGMGTPSPVSGRYSGWNINRKQCWLSDARKQEPGCSMGWLVLPKAKKVARPPAR